MKFNVGDRVEHDFYGKGTIIEIDSIGSPLVEFDKSRDNFHGGDRKRGKDGHCWYTDMIKPLKSQAIVIYPKGLETIALLKEGKKVIKQASAKCNPSDTYDFNIGAKLAFSRLMGEDLTVKEIEVAHSGSIDWEGFKSGKFAVHCDTEEKAKQFLKECDEHGIKWCTGHRPMVEQKETRWERFRELTSYGFSYGGLHFGTYDEKSKVEYRPLIREVKRPAKVGEWIKVVNADEDHCGYKNGDVLKVKTLYPGYEEEGVVKSPYHIASKEYVVLENYQSEATIKTLANYTDKELIDELAKRWEDKQ